MTHFLIKKSYLSTIFFALSVLVLSGCAAPARIDQMAVSGNPAQRIAQTPLRNNLAIKDVTGGNETNPMWKSNVSSSDFEKALESSLQATGLLAQRQSGKYLLTAHMERLDQPFIGLDMTVTASVKYIVSERATGKEVFLLQLTLVNGEEKLEELVKELYGIGPPPDPTISRVMVAGNQS